MELYSVDISRNFKILMEKNNENQKVKVCKRCKKATGADILCTNCKIEVINKYDSKLDWRTAYQIEKVQQSAMRYIDDDF